MATATCAACALLDEVTDAWSCGDCGDEFAHAEGTHDVQYGIYHEFTCYGCEGREQCERCQEWVVERHHANAADLNSPLWCEPCCKVTGAWDQCQECGDRTGTCVHVAGE